VESVLSAVTLNSVTFYDVYGKISTSGVRLHKAWTDEMKVNIYTENQCYIEQKRVTKIRRHTVTVAETQTGLQFAKSGTAEALCFLNQQHQYAEK